MKCLGKGPRGLVGCNRKWKPERRPSHEKYVRGYWLIESGVLGWGGFCRSLGKHICSTRLEVESLQQVQSPGDLLHTIRMSLAFRKRRHVPSIFPSKLHSNTIKRAPTSHPSSRFLQSHAFMDKANQFRIPVCNFLFPPILRNILN